MGSPVRTALSALRPSRRAAPASIEDLRRLARRRLPRMVFDYLEGGAWDEVTLGANEADLRALRLLPRALVDVTRVDTSTSLLGTNLPLPLVLAPTGLGALFHPEADEGAARGAGAASVPYVLSTMSSRSIEDVARAASGPLWFQIYIHRDRGLLREFVERSRAAGYAALCLTVDVPVLGARERDRRNGMTLPPRFGPGALLDALRHPAWTARYLRGDELALANVATSPTARRGGWTTLADYVATQFDPSVTWEDVRWLREQWDGSLLVKGILRPEDAKQAVAQGCDGVIVSNHGGRQLDRAPSAVSALPGVVEAVGDDVPVLLDGGVRRGTDIAAALCLGASAVMIGRAYLYGLAAEGGAGVARAIEILRDELELTLRLLGCRSLGELSPVLLQEH
jgi:L-lactate dehydrogenase (cytochrome)